MGIAERKEREKQRRREDIIDAAEEVFFKKGVASATMDDVAAQAELSKGTLYLYYKSKEDLYLSIHLRGMKILWNLFKEAVNTGETGLETVYALGQAFFKYYQEYPNYFNALVFYESLPMTCNGNCQPCSIQCECAEKGHQTLNMLIGAIEKGIQDGSIKPDIDPPKTALILWGQTSGVFQLMALKGVHFHEEHEVSENDLIDYSFQLIGNMLRAG